MRTGGCTSCGVAPRTVSRDQFSRSYYGGFNRYSSDNNYNSNYNLDNYSNNINQPYVNNSRRIMTPTKNYSSEYSANSYYSPIRNNGGCRECASNSAQISNRNYSRPLTGNPLIRSTNIPRYNMNRDLFNNRNNIDRYGNNEDNDDDNFTFKNRYVMPNSFERNEENNRINRFKSPEINAKRNLLNTRYGNYDSNINNNNSNVNRMNYSVNNNQYNNIRSNISNNKLNPSNNLYNSVSFNNDYKKFLENNINRYNYNRNYNMNNDFLTEKRKMYSSPSPMFDYRRRNIDITRRRFDYLRDVPEPEKNQCEIPTYNRERFIDLTQYNYRPKLLELLRARKTFFVHIFGSHDYTGKSWCSDCNIAKPIVEQGKKIIENKKYEKEVYFLSIPIDKIYMEDFRDDPYIRLERVPTLILFECGFEKGKLIENDLFSYQKVREFILQAYEPGYKRNCLYERRNYY